MKKLYYKIVGFRTRAEYWAHSNFANWVRARLGVEIPPTAATARGWKEYKQRNKGKFGYWLVEEGFDVMQDIVMFPYDAYHNIRAKIENRFITKPWCLDTKLPKTEWHEMDTRVVHGLFETLVDFVEVEKAHRQHITEWLNDDLPNPNWKTPSREKGIEYLDWEISLGDESPYQSANAKEVKELYLWWKDVRPNRPDPMDESGWSAHCDKQREQCKESGEDDFWCMIDNEDDTEDERKETMKLINRSHEIEQQYEDEDTEMLIRLIKARKGMWT